MGITYIDLFHIQTAVISFYTQCIEVPKKNLNCCTYLILLFTVKYFEYMYIIF